MMLRSLLASKSTLAKTSTISDVPAAELMGEVQKLCQRILSKGDVALRMVKEAIEAGSHVDLASGLEIEAK